MQYHNEHHSTPSLPFRAAEEVFNNTSPTKDQNRVLPSHWKVIKSLINIKQLPACQEECTSIFDVNRWMEYFSTREKKVKIIEQTF